MAGGLLSFNKTNRNSKNTKVWSKNTAETLPEAKQAPTSTSGKIQERPLKFSFSGILSLGKKVEIHGSSEQKKPLLANTEYSLPSQEKVLFSLQQEQVSKEISALRQEIQALVGSVKEVAHDVEQAVYAPVTQASKYEINFFQRIHKIIQDLRKNISQAQEWMSTQKTRKSRKNAFWGKVKDKEHGGGTQYLMSNEHSAARSVA